MSMVARFTLIVLFCIVCSINAASGNDKKCTSDEAYRAETEADRLNTWEVLYQSYKRFSHCDDGAIAEGYSDSIGRLLADDWKDISSLVKLCRSDSNFEKFVARHLDETISIDTWEKIISNATNSCPDKARSVCRLILKVNADFERQTSLIKIQNGYEADVHGRLSIYNGNPTFRLWIVGTNRILGISGGDLEPAEMPKQLEKLFTSTNVTIYGDFTVSPITTYQDGVLQFVRIEKAKNLVVYSGSKFLNKISEL